MVKIKYPEDFIGKIICGNCLEVLKQIPDGSVDLVLTDPPYGISQKNLKIDRTNIQNRSLKRRVRMNYQLIADKIEGILDELSILITDDNYELIRGIVENYLLNEYIEYNSDDVDGVMFELFDKALWG